MARRLVAAVAAFGLAALLGQPARADLVLGPSSPSLNSGADLVGSQTVKSQTSDTHKYRYLWADMNGDGSNTAISGGLNLATYNITRSGDAYGFLLDLNNSAITWGGVTGGQLSTQRSPATATPAGPITIQNATDIKVQGIYANATTADWVAGGAINVGQTGDFTATAVLSFTRYGGQIGGAITLTGGGAAAGTLRITSTDSGTNAGAINSKGGTPGNINIGGYKGVVIGAGGINAQKLGNGNTARAEIKITNIGVDGIDASGATLRNDFAGGQGSANVPGITLDTTGLIKVDSVYTYARSTTDWINQNSGSINLSGGGNVTVTGLLDSSSSGSSAANTCSGGAVTVTSNGGAVLLADITATTIGTSSKSGGNVTATANTSLQINGSINLNSASGDAYDGVLALSAGTRIDVAALDCSTFKAPTTGTTNYTFNVTTGVGGNLYSYINGLLTNITISAGNETELYIPTGNTVYYNDSLANTGTGFTNGNSYQSLGGGWLMPESQLVPEPATLAFLAVGGLGMIGAAIKRRRG